MQTLVTNMETPAIKFMPSENIDYILSPDIIDDSNYCIKILLPTKYKDIIFRYYKIQFIEDHEKNSCTLKFNYAIMHNPNGLILKDDTEFKNYLGSILEDILQNNEFSTNRHGE